MQDIGTDKKIIFGNGTLFVNCSSNRKTNRNHNSIRLMDPIKDNLQATYVQHVLENSKRPNSVHQFAKKTGISEEVFYTHFPSLKALEKYVWLGFVEETVQRTKREDVYADYTAREKMLSFFYTLQEVLKSNRSFIKLTLSVTDFLPPLVPSVLGDFRKGFIKYANEVVKEGVDNKEISRRLILHSQYGKMMWNTVLLIVRFWVKDESDNFEKTDTVIEKSVNLAFDLMGRTPVDSAFDLVKFLWSARKAS